MLHDKNYYENKIYKFINIKKFYWGLRRGKYYWTLYMYSISLNNDSPQNCLKHLKLVSVPWVVWDLVLWWCPCFMLYPSWGSFSLSLSSGSFSVSVLSGKIMFRDVHIITEDFSLRIQLGLAIFRWWRPLAQKEINEGAFEVFSVFHPILEIIINV